MEKFSASVASRHMNCRASANLELAIPNWTPPEEDPTKDNAANRGTLMHSLFAGIMTLPLRDSEMMVLALDYTNKLRSRRRFKHLIEETVTVDWLVSTPKTTADLVLYTQDEMHVLDFKTGRIPVDPVENYQLMYYAVTYLPFAPKVSGVYLHIVQPWAHNTDAWFADKQRLTAFREEAQQVEAEILAGNTTFMPGDHCQFCPANPRGRGLKGRPFCPELMQLFYPQEANYAEMMGLE